MPKIGYLEGVPFTYDWMCLSIGSYRWSGDGLAYGGASACAPYALVSVD